MYLCHLGCQVFHLTSQLHFSMDTLDLVAGSRSQLAIAVVKLSIIVNYTHLYLACCCPQFTLLGFYYYCRLNQATRFNLSHRFSATQILEVHLRQKVRLKDGKARAALGKYEEGLYIVDKCREVWLIFLGGLMEGPKNGAELIKDDSTSKNKQESESNG